MPDSPLLAFQATTVMSSTPIGPDKATSSRPSYRRHLSVIRARPFTGQIGAHSGLGGGPGELAHLLIQAGRSGTAGVPARSQATLQVSEPARHRGDPQLRRQLQHRADLGNGTVKLTPVQQPDSRPDPDLRPDSSDLLPARIRTRPCGLSSRPPGITRPQPDRDPEHRHPLIRHRPRRQRQAIRSHPAASLLSQAQRHLCAIPVPRQRGSMRLITSELNPHRIQAACLPPVLRQVRSLQHTHPATAQP